MFFSDSRHIINRPDDKIRKIPIHPDRIGHSENIVMPQKIEIGSAMYSKGATYAASPIRYACEIKSPPRAVASPIKRKIQ